MNIFKKYISYIVKALFIFLALTIIILIFKIPIGKDLERSKKFLVVEHRKVDLISDIKPANSGYVTPVIYNDIKGLNELTPGERKQRFIDIILPAILIAKYEIGKENKKTVDLWGKLKSGARISESDSLFMEFLFEKYESKNFAEINLKQQLHPNSIIIAQAALETGWGTSRFFLRGNNAFGIWSYDPLENRMPSNSTRGRLKIYLRSYDNILESVHDYFLTISQTWAYDEFRKERGETDNAYKLIWYLNKYSELRNDYVKMVGELMITNELSKYDTSRLDPEYFVYRKR